MPEATFHFPRGFLWGTATAAHQVEGGNTNNNPTAVIENCALTVFVNPVA